MQKTTNKNSLISLLSIFKQSREMMVEDFLGEDEDIFRYMFKYENNKEMMGLSIYRYFASFINSHFNIYKEHGNLDDEFSKAMLMFLKMFDFEVYDTNLAGGDRLFSHIIKEKISIIDDIINIGDKDFKRYNSLLYSYERDKALFDREMNKER